MDTGTAIVGLGVVIAFFAYLETIRRDLRSEIRGIDTKLSNEIKGIDTKLSNEIKEVRQASETAHKSILAELADAKAERASITERLKCVEDKVDDLKRSSD
ncbi:MAG: hypothetical protein OXE95_12345 [Chloroflexi bacterium]|nr:hypothetical protein [Chloroflexota bacterium]MCY4248351.1 hypothetical protein [Chloroflexota bacterium]